MKRKIYRRMSVIAVDRTQRDRFMFRCEDGHTFWQKQFIGKGRLRKPMDDSQSRFFANYWRPGQGCHGVCPTCTKEFNKDR